MKKSAPQKEFIPAPPEANCACNNCPYMKLNTLDKLYRCMLDRRPSIEMEAGLRERALAPIQRMLAMS